MPPSVKQLQYFIAAAQAGKISEAAAAMNVTQSSITLSIKALEQNLGYDLFHRMARGVELTEDGAQFLRHATIALAVMQDLMNLPPTSAPTCPEIVHMALSDTITGYFLPNFLDAVRRELPHLTIRMTELHRPEIEDRIASGEFDLAIALTSNVRRQDLQCIPLIVSPRRLWVADNHRLAHRDTVSVSELQDEPYFLLQTDDHEDTMRRNWDSHGFTPNIVLRTFSIEGVRSLIAGGHGIGILSDTVYRPWSLEGKRILRKPLQETFSSMDTGIILRQNMTPSPSLQRLIQLAHRQVQNNDVYPSQIYLGDP